MKSSSYETILRELMPKQLQERRDYGTLGMDQLEENAVALLEKGVKLPMMLELRIREKHKKAFIIDYPQDSLCHQIWDSSKEPPTLKSKIRDKILSDLEKVLSLYFNKYKEWLSDVSLTGSMTTNQYNPDTDVDVNVSIDYDVFRKHNQSSIEHISNDLELKDLIRDKVYKLNGRNLTGDHSIKYFVMGKGKRIESDFVYDILHDKWAIPPKLVEQSFDPDDEFAGPRSKALQIIMSIIPFILKTKVHLSDLIRIEIGNKDTSEIKKTLQVDINELNEMQKKIKGIGRVRFESDDNDLLSYAFSKNWEFNNIVFKYVEKYGFSKIFRVLNLLLTDKEKDRFKKIEGASNES